MSLDVYRSTQNHTETSRRTEYRLFAVVTRALMTAEEEDGGKSFFEAVHRNRRLWIALQMDLASPDNRLGDELKAGLVSLSIWVDKHSSKVLQGKAEIEPLISVNRRIMAGLL